MTIDPGQLRKLDKKLDAQLRAEAQAETINFPERQGWVEKGLYFTCKPNVEHPWRPEIIKAIWEFDPNVIPCWVNWVFDAPKEQSDGRQEVVFGRHVIARYVDDPQEDIDEFPCDMPTMPCQGITFKKPNRLVTVLMKKNEQNDLPGEYIDLDWTIVEWLRASFVREQSTKELAKAYVDAARREYNKRKAQLVDEWEYRGRDLKRFVDKKLANVSEVEIKEYLHRKREREKKPWIFLNKR